MTINTSQLYFILDNTPAEQNIMLVGKHGIGKSRILEDYYSDVNSKNHGKVVTLFLGQMSDPGDLIGLPEKNEKTGKTDFMLPYWFPLDNTPVVLFLDELNRARPEVLQTIMDLTLNRKLAGKSLPEGSRIISAVNNGNEYQLTDLDPALVSRFNIYEFAPSVSDWLDWAEKDGIDERIISFISENPEYLDGSEVDSDSNDLERTPDRRSWERTSHIIKKFPELSDLHKPLVSGIIGNKACAMFFKFAASNKKECSASKVLTENFSETRTLLCKMSPVELTQLNKGVFQYIEAGIDEKLKSVITENLKNYYLFLGENGLREVKSHFVSLCSANIYPETLNFISENCFEELYKDILNFVKES